MGNKVEKIAVNIIDKKSTEWANQVYNPSMLQTFPNLTESQLRDHLKLYGSFSLQDGTMDKKDFKMLVTGGFRDDLNKNFGTKDTKDIAGALLMPLLDTIIFKLFYNGSYWDKEDDVIQRLFTAMDTSKNGKIELNEFLYVINLIYGGDKELFETIYRAANLSHTGSLDAKEAASLKAALDNQIPVSEAETLSQFVQKSADPQNVNIVKKRLKWAVQPSELAIKSITGRYTFIPFDANDTVDAIKIKIQDREGIPPEQIKLFYKGTLLQDPLSNYSLVPGQTDTPVYIKLSLR